MAGVCLLNPLQTLAGAHEGGQAADGFEIGDLALNIYGFVQADTIYDFKRVDPDWNDTLRVSTIRPGEPYGGDGEVVFGVRQTRIGFDSNFETDNGDVRALFEWELFGTGGTRARPRRVCGMPGWSGRTSGWPALVELHGSGRFPQHHRLLGADGQIFYRNQQVRYTFRTCLPIARSLRSRGRSFDLR